MLKTTSIIILYLLYQLEIETNNLRKRLTELKVFKEKLEQLADQLMEQYRSFIIEHCDEPVRIDQDDQTRQEKLYSERLKRLKESDCHIRAQARLNKDFTTL